MDATKLHIPNTPVRMDLDDIEQAPRHPMPEGYRARRWQPGDSETWLAIHYESERFHMVSSMLYQ